MRGLAIAAAVLLGGCQLLIDLDEPVGDQCSPFDVDSCDITETCEYDDEDNGGYLACRDPGDRMIGDLCDAFGDCGEGLTCADGICRSFCSELGSDCADPEEGECLYNFRGQLTCDSECDVFDITSCGVGRICELSINEIGRPISLCLPENYSGIVEYNQRCTYLTECIPGLACYDTNPGDDIDEGVCVHMCTGADACPDEGTTCEDVFLETLHGQPVGLCPPP
jgi:hypothetical protein